MTVRLSEGQSVEVALVGRDGVFGASAALDGGIALTDAAFFCRGRFNPQRRGSSGGGRAKRCPSSPARTT